MRKALVLAGFTMSLGASPAQANEQLTFLEYVKQVSSAVAPLRMPERTTTAVLPGRFSGRRADAVLITNDNASLCRGPDYRRCLSLGSLPTKRTVATTVKGESVLLVLDSMSAIRACTVARTTDTAPRSTAAPWITTS